MKNEISMRLASLFKVPSDPSLKCKFWKQTHIGIEKIKFLSRLIDFVYFSRLPIFHQIIKVFLQDSTVLPFSEFKKKKKKF